MPIAEAFERHGEEGFRAREAEVVGSLLESADGGAIALGGGSVLSERIRAALGRHVVVWLQVDAREAWRRIAHSDRPLATSAEDVAELLAVREPLYEELADAVVPVGDREIVARALPASAGSRGPAGRDQAALGDERLRRVPDLRRRRPARCPRRLGLRADLVAGIGAPLLRRRRDDRIALRRAPASRLPPAPRSRPGRARRRWPWPSGVLRELARAGMTREDHVVALGGGVVGDLAGLCAHLYQRGVPVVQVPTTLVAQVDSAYGGKTGVDLPEGKNYAGAYHLPAAVARRHGDPGDAAAARSWRPASSRSLKTGLLAGGSLWERVRGIDSLDPAGLDDVVFACARYKCEVVAADERDGGRRHVLNLGHTVGHAIEAASGYERYRHGEAVGLGLLAALRLSERARAARGGARPTSPATSCRRASDSGDRRRRHPRLAPARQEAHRRRGRVRPPRRAGRAPHRAAGRPR